MQNTIKRIYEKYFGQGLAFRVRLFNAMAFGGIVVSFCTVLFALAYSTWSLVFIGIFGIALSAAILIFAARSGRYQLCYIISIIVIFLFLFPLIFFMGGGYDGPAILVFFMGICFTAFMLEGKVAILVLVVELVVYSASITAVFLQPELVSSFISESARFVSIIAIFVAISVVLAATILIHSRLYSNQQKMLAQQNQQLENLNRQKAVLLSDISHEIRTPLTVMSGYAQSARKQIAAGKADEETIQGLLVIQLEAQRLANLAQQLVITPLSEEGDILSGSVDPDELVQQATRMINPILEKNNNHLTQQIEKDCPPVHTNADMIIQVLMNLCINANRHMQDGEITLEIVSSGDMVTFNVADNGDGISEELLPIVFERGKSGDGESGIGLAICKDVVESHGGEIGITSKKGVGTRVTFTLPIARATAKENA